MFKSGRYSVYWYRELKDNDITFPTNAISIKKSGKYAKSYIELYCGFDIETTNILPEKLAFMYIWQFSINDVVVLGRTWDEFIELLERIQSIYTLRNKVRLLVWVANLSFEFQFLRHHMKVTDIFAKQERQPLMVTFNNVFEFHDCLAVSGGSLSKLAEDYTETQKLVGDLDYSIIRNNRTKLTDDELQYCINDVAILSEFSEFMFNNFICNGFLPLTRTAILRKEVKDYAKKNDKLRNAIINCFPDMGTYELMMRWLFRGGYVHCNALYTQQVLIDIASRDYTSSYPYTMLHQYVPVSRFYKINDINKFEEYCKTHCVVFIADFYNIRVTTSHTIESKSKLMQVDGGIYDNGRLSSANHIRVFLTELDYDVYKHFYQWDSMSIVSSYKAVRGKLPKYLTIPLMTALVDKQKLKMDGKNYAIEKSKVNSAYGLTVQRICVDEVTYTDGEWGHSDEQFNYQKVVRNSVLLPQWGIYITAHARHNLLMGDGNCDNVGGLALLDDDGIYCDTDSLKYKNPDKWEWYFKEYNERRMLENLQLAKEYNVDYDIIKDLGCFDNETSEKKGGLYTRFKTLGAKRYIYEQGEKVKCTIAGLPKATLNKYASKHNVDVFTAFDNLLNIELDESDKLTTRYNDEPSEYIVDGVLMREKSSVCLYSIPFKLTMAQEYLDYASELKNRNERRLIL